MADPLLVLEGIHKQFNSIRNSKSKWNEIVKKSGEIFTTISYNLMREFASIRNNKPEDIWSIDLIPQCSAACRLFLSGDPVGAAHLAAAKRIEADYEFLEKLLEQIRDVINSVDKSVQRLRALRKLRLNPISILDSPISTSNPEPKKISKRGNISIPHTLSIDRIPWSVLQSESDALLRRLHSDLNFREALLKTLSQSVTMVTSKSSSNDLGEFQRLSFLWRQADQLVKWENLLELEGHIEESFS